MLGEDMVVLKVIWLYSGTNVHLSRKYLSSLCEKLWTFLSLKEVSGHQWNTEIEQFIDSIILY